MKMFILREVDNGWVLEISSDTGSSEQVFTKPNPAVGVIRKVISGELTLEGDAE